MLIKTELRNIKEENKKLNGNLILLILKNIEEAFEDFSVAAVILKQLYLLHVEFLNFVLLGTRKLTSTLKRKAFESSVGEMGSIDTDQGKRCHV